MWSRKAAWDISSTADGTKLDRTGFPYPKFGCCHSLKLLVLHMIGDDSAAGFISDGPGSWHASAGGAIEPGPMRGLRLAPSCRRDKGRAAAGTG